MTLCARGHRAFVSSLGLHRTIVEGPPDRFRYLVGPCEELPVTLHLVHPAPQRHRLTQAECDALDRALARARAEDELERIRGAVRPRVARWRRRRARREALHGAALWLVAALAWVGLGRWRDDR